MTPNEEKSNWLDIVETLSVVGSIGGSIASVVFQQVGFASIPLSLSVTLGLVNRRRLLDTVNQSNNHTAIAQLTQESSETHAKLGTLTQQLLDATSQSCETKAELGTLTQQFAEVQQMTADLEQRASNLPVAQLTQDNAETQARLETLTEKIAEVQQLTADLSQSTSNLPVTQLMQESAETQAKLETLTKQIVEVQQLTTNLSQAVSSPQDYIQTSGEEQTEIANTVNRLQEIESCTQAIRINPSDAKAYYNRGTTYQNLGYKEAAVWDYSEAIRIKPNYAEAYRDRGLIQADQGDRKGAVRDLREAAKLFFEAGDIANYQIAKDLNQKFHQLNSQPRDDAPETVGSLFA